MESNALEEVKRQFCETLFKPCLLFQFGPFKVWGNYSSIGDIKPDRVLYEMGFRKLQTIQDIQVGSTKAVLLFHEDKGMDVAILLPEKYPSWNPVTLNDEMLIIIKNMTIFDNNRGLIVQDKPLPLKAQSRNAALHSYTEEFPVYGYDICGTQLERRTEYMINNDGIQGVVVHWNCECGILSDEVFKGRICPSCNTKAKRKVVAERLDNTSFLVNSFLQTVHETSNEELAPHRIGTLIQTFEPPLTEVLIDQDTPWKERIELIEDVPNLNISVSSTYEVVCDMINTYTCQFVDYGNIRPFGATNTSITSCFRLFGTQANVRLPIIIGNIIDAISIPYLGPDISSICISYEELDTSIFKQVDSKFKNIIGDRGYKLRFRLDKTNPADYILQAGAISVRLMACAGFIIPYINTMDIERPGLEIPANFYFVSNYTISTTGKVKSWTKTKFSLVWRINPIVICGDILHIKVMGTVYRSSDRVWLAKTADITWAEDKVSECTENEEFQIDWKFNIEALEKGTKGKTCVQSYMENFKNIVQAIGIDTRDLNHQIVTYMKKWWKTESPLLTYVENSEP